MAPSLWSWFRILILCVSVRTWALFLVIETKTWIMITITTVIRESDNHNGKVCKYVCVTTNQPIAKSNPNCNPNPTARQHTIVSLQLNIVTFPTYPEKFIWDIVIAPFLPLSVVIVTAQWHCVCHCLPPNRKFLDFLCLFLKLGKTSGVRFHFKKSENLQCCMTFSYVCFLAISCLDVTDRR